MLLLSLALMIFLGYALGGTMQRLRLPPLLGMMLTGMILGPYGLGLIAPSLLEISTELRQIALIVILLRAGLSLDVKALARMGRSAVMMCFVPAACEMLAVTVLAPLLLGLSYWEGAVLGAVLAAVSPAVVVPRMLKLMEEGYGREQGIPQLVMAGASVDDVFVIVMFTALTGMQAGTGFDFASLGTVPVSILLGVALGLGMGEGAAWLFRRLHMRDTVKVMLLLGVAFLLVWLETAVKAYLPLSGLLAVMSMGAALLHRNGRVAHRLSQKYGKIWVAAELMLFALVGAAVDLSCLQQAGYAMVALLLGALVFRGMGVLLCLLGTSLTARERAFVVLSYMPKATVQAAIGGLPLAMGMTAGPVILAAAALAILLTAPLGAACMDCTYRRWLRKPVQASVTDP